LIYHIDITLVYIVLEAEIHSSYHMVTQKIYVGAIAGFSKNTGTTIYGMTAQYWKSVFVGFENCLVSLRLTAPQRKAGRYILLWIKNHLTEQ
jgi:hypothetical protein